MFISMKEWSRQSIDIFYATGIHASADPLGETNARAGYSDLFRQVMFFPSPAASGLKRAVRPSGQIPSSATAPRGSTGAYVSYYTPLAILHILSIFLD